jgi:hypothetical protein
MSEQILRVLIGEVESIRVTCNKCKSSVDLSLDTAILECSGKCKVCGRVYYASGEDPIIALARSVKDVQSALKSDGCFISVSLPVDLPEVK